MNRERLTKHVRLCRKNLRSPRIKCCATCPFEDEITGEYPDLVALFEKKRETCKTKSTPEKIE